MIDSEGGSMIEMLEPSNEEAEEQDLSKVLEQRNVREVHRRLLEMNKGGSADQS